MIEIAAAIGAGLAGVLAGFWLFKLRNQMLQGSFEEQKQRILKSAEDEKGRLLTSAEMDAKAKLLRVQEEVDRESKRHREELLRYEKRLRQRETKLESRSESFDKRERKLRDKERRTQDSDQKAQKSLQKAEEALKGSEVELERVAGLSRQEAREELMSEIEGEARAEVISRVQEMEEKTLAEAEERAQKVIANSIQRLAGGFVSEKTISVVRLPSDDMKGRIIGREGRNIRSLEAASGVDVIIDDTPEVVILSAFNPYRRRVAKTALERLIEDGRIHPARIEEVVDAVKEEMDEHIVQSGEEAILELGLQGFHGELSRLIGLLGLRAIQGQNLLGHSIETGFLAGMIASEIGFDAAVAKRAGLLHDIGRSVDHPVEGAHFEIGADIAKRYGERKVIVAAIREHHEFHAKTTLGSILQAADLISKARPGARKDRLDNYIRRNEDMEALAKSFGGVEQAFAIQAGTEVRVMVNYSKVSDGDALALSREIANRIEDEMSYPGEVRVTVIREARASEVAR